MKLDFLPTNKNNAEWLVHRWLLTFLVINLIIQFWRIFSLNATYDQGIFLQEIWNCLHGRFFESTLASELSSPVKFGNAYPQLGYRHLAQHFTPLLVSWVPIVAILGVWALPIIQVSLITLAGYVLFQLSKEYLSVELSGWITCSFLATGTVIGPTLENFHDLCLIPLLVFSLLLGISRNHKILYFIPALLLPLVREDVGLLSFSIGIWMIFRRPRWRYLGIGLCFYSFISVLLITNLIMPIFGSELSERFMQERFGQYLTEGQGSTVDVLIGMANQPFLLFREIFSPFWKTFIFLLTLAIPLAFIPCLSIDSFLLIGIPLFVALSSQGGNALSVHLRFVLYLVPGVFAGSIFWWEKHTYLFRVKAFRNFWKICIIISFIFAIAGNPHRSLSAIIPDSIDPWVHIPIHKQLLRGMNANKLLRAIPKQYSVAADTHLIPQLAERRILLRFPENYKYIDLKGKLQIVDFVVSQPHFNASYAAAFTHQKEWVDRSTKSLEMMVSSNQYGVLFCDSSSIVLKSGLKTRPTDMQCFSKEISQAKEKINKQIY